MSISYRTVSDLIDVGVREYALLVAPQAQVSLSHAYVARWPAVTAEPRAIGLPIPE